MRGYGETTRRIRWRDEVKDDLVICGEIAQGVIDAEFHANGDIDRCTQLAPELQQAWPADAERLNALGEKYRDLLRESLSARS